MMDVIVERLKAVILMVEPGAAFVEKYGGLIVESVPEQPKSQLCGIFAYRRHVSLEFTHGSQMDDPDRLLEGRGRHRRHIKIARLSDITEKRCEDFLRQARGLQGNFV
jgi:hypothetical protein